MFPIKSIGPLMPEQETLLPAIRQEWQTNGWRTDPVDWDAAERALTGLYEWAGLKAPIFIHFSSPLGCELFFNCLADQETDVDSGQLNQFEGRLRRQLRDGSGWLMETGILDQLTEQIANSIGDRLGGQSLERIYQQLWEQYNAFRDQVVEQIKEYNWAAFRGILVEYDLLFWARYHREGASRTPNSRITEQFGRQLGYYSLFWWPDKLEKKLWAGIDWNLAELRDDQTYQQLVEPLREQQVGLVRQLFEHISEELRRGLVHIGPIGLGQLDGNWIAYHSFARSIGVQYPAREQEGLDLHTEIARQCFFWYPFDSVCVLSDRPTSISLDQHGRLHCEDGQALAFRDGWGIFAWHGVRVRPEILLHPETITANAILFERNVEVRRVMMYRYGLERALHDLGAELEQSDGYGDLYRLNLRGQTEKFVRVVNATPDVDGTYRDYIIPVWPDVTTAHEAVARTYGRTPDTYSPEVRA